jgi:hypothetical protein
MTAESQFYAEIRQGTERLKREIGYNPTYFTRMVADHGPSRRPAGGDGRHCL